jgi:hypothetical protein
MKNYNIAVRVGRRSANEPIIQHPSATMARFSFVALDCVRVWSRALMRRVGLRAPRCAFVLSAAVEPACWASEQPSHYQWPSSDAYL